MRLKISIFTFSIFTALLLSFSCNKKNKNENNSDFSKTELLTNLGENIILPSYLKLKLNIEDFEAKHTAFILDKTVQNFDAMDFGLQAAIGTFPSDSAKILTNITNGSYNLATSDNSDAIGIPAFDFLLYRTTAFEDYSSNTNYSNYALALIQKMKNEVTAVYNLWNTSYLETFKASTGTESTSGFSLFINSFVKSYEDTKWTKLGIPLGKQSLGIAQPIYIETRLSKISFELFAENMDAWKRTFNGDKENGTSGIGLDDYLIDLDRTSLATTINSTLSNIISDINNLDSDFETLLTTNFTALDALYTQIQNLTVSIKTDMTSVMGVLITYQDNDGD
jgi:uncharacterized protein